MPSRFPVRAQAWRKAKADPEISTWTKLNSGLGKCPSRFRQRAERRAHPPTRVHVAPVTLDPMFLRGRVIAYMCVALDPGKLCGVNDRLETANISQRS